jgi:hypothetical protein
MSKLSLIPIRENLRELELIDTIARLRLERDHNIVIEDTGLVITIAYRFLELATKLVASKKNDKSDYKLNVLSLFEIGATYMETQEAEKFGNYNPIVSFLDDVKEKIIKKEKLSRVFDKRDDDRVSVIKPTVAVSELGDVAIDTVDVLLHENRIDIKSGEVIITITIVFLEELINWLMDNHIPGNDLVISFSQLVEFGISYEDDTLFPFITPGQEMKLIIKNDEDTEED